MRPNIYPTEAGKMKYTEELEKWLAKERASDRADHIVDLKFFPGVDPEGSLDKLSRAALDTVTGKRNATPLDTSKL
jgi:hypothetical protein